MSNSWDEEYDVVVVGSGAAGMTAAVTASIEGLSVLLVEKTDRIGGSTALSGGVLWIPGNSLAQGAGVPDSTEAAMTYLDATVGDSSDRRLRSTFVTSASEMIEYVRHNRMADFTVRTVAPDYYPDKPGATLGGRNLDPVEFDGRRLGRHFAELRDPLRIFTVLSGMMVTTTDAKHLLAVQRSFASFRYGVRIVLRYLLDRLLGYHRGARLVLGNALAAHLFHSVLERRIPYWLSAGVERLDTENGAVTGITVKRDGSSLRVRARRGVVIATGGFPWNLSLKEETLPKPTSKLSMAPETNAGDGIAYAREAGATYGQGHSSAAYFAPVSVLKNADGSVVRYPHFIWDRAKPGLIAVNSSGQRFVNEATSYHEFVLGMYRSHAQVATMPAWLVCDSAFLKKWGLGLALPGGRPHEHLVKQGYLLRGASIGELAAKTGVDAEGLRQSVQQMNEAAAAGVDAAFGKGGDAYNRYLGDPDHIGPNPCLGPISAAPYYAVAVQPGDIGTALGIKCDEHARAVTATGVVIPGLYVVGNDMHSMMGGNYAAAGITLGPGMTFGWRAARHLAGRVDD